MLAVLTAGWAMGADRPATPAAAPMVSAPPSGSAALGPGRIGERTQADAPGFVGSAACAGCHATQTKAWLGSHHAHAMAAATPKTVLGDFSGVTAEHKGSTARFFREGDRFFVETDGRDGKPEIFAVDYTFGVYPLQQYLVAFPDGRLQALPFAWDSRPVAEGGERWFHLYADRAVPSGDPLHWTRSLQNWNFMCAECHSTALRKGYDAATNTFNTTFSEVSVGCEACHGAGAGHLAWARAGASPAVPLKGFASAPAMRDRPDWTPDAKTGSPAHGIARQPGDEVELCARCHARRAILSEHARPGQALTDTHMPSLLTSDLFTADGVMQDEVFNDHSFKQSLMNARGVVCSDCHDPHSGEVKAARAAEVCGQCHLPERFAVKAHTGHEPGPGAPDCVSCHMPERTYMVVDRRHDHSFRIPRPDLSVRFGTPNTCNDCHRDRSPAWAAAAVEAWHGPERKGFQTWTEAFHLARRGDPAAREQLIRLANDPVVPAIARATAVAELGNFPSAATEAAVSKALSSPDPLVRAVAVRGLLGQPLEVRWRRASDLLADPSLAVRVEAAALLADQPPDALSPADRERLLSAFADYEAVQRLNADRAEGRANLGSFLLRRGHPDQAEAEFKAGLALQPDAALLAVNLADLYRTQRREADAERVLRHALSLQPDAAAIRHALGLSLIRQKRYDEALQQLKRATEGAPDAARYAYVYAVALRSMGGADAARSFVDEALKRLPNDPGLLELALGDALTSGDAAKAAPLAARLSAMRPDDASLARTAAMLQRR